MLIPLFQSVAGIEEKIQSAPDKGYEIGVVIGTYLPFILLIIIAYVMYYFAKKRNQDK